MSDLVNAYPDNISGYRYSKAPSVSAAAVPDLGRLQSQLAEANALVDDIVLKNYLTKLTDLELVPIPDHLKKIGDIRLFQITEMVYQKDEYSTYKFASVFNSVQNLNCAVFVIADSDGKKTDFYMGIRAMDNIRTTKSLKDTLRNALCGQFPGVKTKDLLDTSAEELLNGMSSKNIAAVSCVAQNKDAEFKDNERFIQGLDKLVLAMQGQRYTAIILAKSTPSGQLAQLRHAYETIYTQLSPFATMQMGYGKNAAVTISDAFSHGTSTGTSHGVSHSTQTGRSQSVGTSNNESASKMDSTAVLRGLGTSLLGVAGMVAAPLTGGASLAVAGGIMAAQIGLSTIKPKTVVKGSSTQHTDTENSSQMDGTSDTASETTSQNQTSTKGSSSGTSETMQLTLQNKTLVNTLERIDMQLKRIEECESLGMWECAGYFLSDNQETAEMAAGTYKALMNGEKSGIETSAINFWGRSNARQLPMLRNYIKNLIHPVFQYQSASGCVPVTASSLISGNELAIQMGLPRKSICGLPVVEHAEFGREVVHYDQHFSKNSIILGKVFTMGSETQADAALDRDSLTMHAFITGSTGSGKSNTIYEILHQLRTVHQIPFLVVEPAKGEYKNRFGQFTDVSVYGTNPKKGDLLRINPFRFPSDIHVLEHLDRLVELFNVCWPMYAAMPAILKEAMEQAYIAVGWNLSTSENPKGEVFPNFADLLEQIEFVIAQLKYSSDSKGDYSGALCTRVRSLTNGLNGLIFTNDDLTDAQLFDQSVIVDLSRVGSVETKSFIMGLMVMKLGEYRLTLGETDSPLKHVTVLEEAHHLLKRTSTEQSSEGANVLGKSVEMLANSIAEMRTYGEGFLIADQSPGMLDLSVIRNTNTKIILRLPERSDRELVGYAAGLNEKQIDELSKLERGVAAVYQNDWVDPVLVKFEKCKISEISYDGAAQYAVKDLQKLWQQLIFFLIQGRVKERLEFHVTEIEQGLDSMKLSSRNREFIEELLLEYQHSGSLQLWEESGFSKLSRRLADLMGMRTQVENDVSQATSNTELTNTLKKSIQQMIPNASKEVILAICHSFIKDFSMGVEESDVRERIYRNWVDDVKGIGEIECY